MKVAITDYTFPSLEIEESILRPLGHDVVGGQCKVVDALISMVRDADAVMTQFAPVNATVIGAMQRAKVIVRYGIGVDNVDLEAARVRGIPVCNVPEFCIDEVADHTMGFILAATRQLLPNCLHVRNRRWGLAVPLPRMLALRDLTVGIVGFGRIGKEVAHRLAPFKCRRIVFDPAVPAETVTGLGCEPMDLAAVLSQSDVVSLHCPSTRQTRHLINAESIQRMKPGSILVNVARGDVVDAAALIEALRSGHLSAAALDVFDTEPVPADCPLLAMDNVVITSHIASASPSAARTLRTTAAQIAAMALGGEKLPNVVNG
jgi:D-3-phosphoglycerate dehydrogenase